MIETIVRRGHELYAMREMVGRVRELHQDAIADYRDGDRFETRPHGYAINYPIAEFVSKQLGVKVKPFQSFGHNRSQNPHVAFVANSGYVYPQANITNILGELRPHAFSIVFGFGRPLLIDGAADARVSVDRKKPLAFIRLPNSDSIQRVNDRLHASDYHISESEDNDGVSAILALPKIADELRRLADEGKITDTDVRVALGQLASEYGAGLAWGTGILLDRPKMIKAAAAFGIVQPDISSILNLVAENLGEGDTKRPNFVRELSSQ